MSRVLAVLVAGWGISLAGTAYTATTSSNSETNVEYKDDGGYESNRSSERVTSSGTKHSTESTMDVEVDSKGRVDKTIKTEASTDAKGLMNKKDELSETNITEKERGGYEQTTIRKHKDADGTNITYKTVTDVTVDKNGEVTTTATTKKTVDPEGLFNEKTTTSKTKTVNGRVVERTKKTN